MRQRTVLFMRNVTWQRVWPTPSVPARAKDSVPTRRVGPDDGSTSDQGGGGVVDEQGDGLAHLNDLDVTWGFDVDAFRQEREQRVPAASEAGNEAPETVGSFKVAPWTPPRPR